MDIKKIEFLIFIIFIEEVRMNSKRIQMIKKWSQFKIYCEMRIFLKFVNFYKRFIYRYFKRTAPLTSLFKDSENEKKSNSFKWSNKAEQAFCQLRDILILISLFTHYNFLKKNRVEIDVSNFAVASIFNQEWQLTFDDVLIAQNNVRRIKL